jgi:glycine/D-amino acid oxidase-like deaminating enzyme
MIVGAISYAAGAIWPYRFVASIWKSLLTRFPSSLSIETNTPVLSITTISTANSASSPARHPYAVLTRRGSIHARHVIHATNAYSNTLLPGLRGKLAGVLAHMSAQRPGPFLPDLDGGRSWSVIYGKAFDYVTQRPTSKSSDGSKRTGDLMLGGGFARAADQGVGFLGEYNDSKVDALSSAHLMGIFPAIFGKRWRGEVEGGGKEESQATMVWTGILAITGDFCPFVGRLDDRLTGRTLSASRAALQSTEGKKGLGDGTGEGEGDGWGAEPGEWISAGYCGDGMVWAWLCGSAVAEMVAGKMPNEVDGFPSELLASYERVRKADLVNLLDEIM